MKKILLSSIAFSSLLYANDTNITYEYGIKEYKNSASKIDGKIHSLSMSHKISNHKFYLGYQGDNVNRTVNPISGVNRDLDVEKYSTKYIYKANDKIKVKASYIKIVDNQAPTDQGKVYGLGGKYTISKGLNALINVYKSDYQSFDVNQYDLGISKGFKINDLKLKATLIAKKIKIDGTNYATFTFTEKNYFTTGLKLGANYNNFIGGLGAFFGERAFTVLDDGVKVQHHAIRQDKTYMISLGKKFKNFDIIAKYSFQNGKELAENRDNVDTKVMLLSLNYKF